MSYNGEEISPSEWDEAERRDIDGGGDGCQEDEDWNFEDTAPHPNQETGVDK